MKHQWFEEYCTSKTGAYKEYKAEWDVDRYMIRDRMFVMHGGDGKGKEIITVKLEPAFGEVLREQYKGDIIPGYYMNKQHWNTVYIDGDVPEQEIREMIEHSFDLTKPKVKKKT
jgi:predicted DNA-binding protein (MmcQ/YjbR family)